MARVASSNELNYGDGAAALLCGTENVIAKLVGHHSVSMDFVDHFRGDETDFDYGWEERWIRDEGYSKIVPPAIKAALAACKLKGSEITHFIMPSLMPAMPQADGQDLRHRRGRGARPSGRHVSATPAAAHALVMLVDALETAKQGDKIMVVAFGQGVDIAGVRGHAENAKLPKRKGVSGWMARRKEEKNYMKFLAFNEMLPIEQGHARGVRQEDRAVGPVAQARHDLRPGRRQVQGVRHRAVPAQPDLRQSELPRRSTARSPTRWPGSRPRDVVHRRLRSPIRRIRRPTTA